MLTAPHPVPSGRGRHFRTSKISRRLPQAAVKIRAAPAVLSAISEEHIIPTKDRDRTRAPTEERRSVLSERTLRGAQRTVLAAPAPVLRDSAGRDASGARPNWATIAASPGNPTTKSPAHIEKSGTSGEWGASRRRLALSLRRRIIVIWTRASRGIGVEKARTEFIVGRDTQVVPGASLRAHVSPTRRQNTLSVEPPLTSPRIMTPGVTQEDAAIPPGSKNPSTSMTTEIYQDVLPLPLADMFSGRSGRPEMLGGK